jgi:hypothetical protein
MTSFSKVLDNIAKLSLCSVETSFILQFAPERSEESPVLIGRARFGEVLDNSAKLNLCSVELHSFYCLSLAAQRRISGCD